MFGWQNAGTGAVVAPQPAEPRVFEVREFGARGEDLGNDFQAICDAIAAAKNAGGGEVFFPPGVWRSDTTITLPTGVSFRGASRDNTILEGFGPPSSDGYVTSLIHLSSGTGLHGLTFQGATYKGPHAYGGCLVSAMPTGKDTVFEDLRIANCRFYSSEVRSGELPKLTVKAIGIPPCSRTRLLDNDIHGPAYYNLIESCWLDGSMVHLFSDVKAANTYAGPALFGNYVVGNHIREAHRKRTGFNMYPKAEGAIRVGNEPRAAGIESRFAGRAHLRSMALRALPCGRHGSESYDPCGFCPAHARADAAAI